MAPQPQPLPLKHGPAGMAEKEFALIREIARDPAKTQRDLSHDTGLSLGMTNLILKRLARKGYVKIRQLNWNKTQYLLTLKGSVLKARKSYAYAVHVLRQARKLTRAIQETVAAEHAKGARRATVVAWPETADIIRRALAEKEFAGLAVEYVAGYKHVRPDAPLVFSATVEPAPSLRPGQRLVPLLDKVDLEFRFPA